MCTLTRYLIIPTVFDSDTASDGLARFSCIGTDCRVCLGSMRLCVEVYQELLFSQQTVSFGATSATQVIDTYGI